MGRQVSGISHRVRCKVHPGHVASPSQNPDRQPVMLIFTPVANLKSPGNLTSMSLHCGREQKYPGKIPQSQEEHENSTQKGPSQQVALKHNLVAVG